jgi:hypothetical protein
MKKDNIKQQKYLQQAQQVRDRRMSYLVERPTKGTMIHLSMTDSVETVTEGGADVNAI